MYSNRICLHFVFFSEPDNNQHTRKQQLLQYLKPFERTPKSPGKLSAVDGFSFPVYTADEVERLEEAVRSSRKIRSQYVAFLAERKPRYMDIPECFSKFFTDEAMTPYAWHGCKNPRFPRRAMKTMDIFSDCMLEAWKKFGVTPSKTLRRSIKSDDENRRSSEI
ncbi:uncharacterized protein LOC134221523 [Armigeres subalbatus]|uniref:uncharacterized protein LOC134221523 n=1 Tax=Armigeres subalbatus TaxID=124917 RepID=UPI002ED08CFF